MSAASCLVACGLLASSYCSAEQRYVVHVHRRLDVYVSQLPGNFGLLGVRRSLYVCVSKLP